MAAFVQHMRVQHGRADVLVTEQFLNGPDVVTSFKEVRGERMPKCVAPGMLDHTGPADGLLDGLLQNRLGNMMPAFFAGLGVPPSMFLGKDPLPAPVLWHVGILAVQGVGQENTAPPLGQIFLVDRFHLVQVDVERS